MRYRYFPLVVLLIGGCLLSMVSLAGSFSALPTTTRIPESQSAGQHLRFAKPQDSGAATHRHELRVAVNGKDHPELIPDEYAYRHFIEATAFSDQQTASERDASRARVEGIGFSDADNRVYEDTLKQMRVHDELGRIAHERRALTADSLQGASAARSLQAARRNLLDETRERLLLSLSPEGRAALDKHIQENVKERIQILTGTMQP